jgi:hypothetical protein
MRGRLSRLAIPFEQRTPGEGVNLTDEDEASSLARQPSPGTRLPPSTPEVWHEWGVIQDFVGQPQTARTPLPFAAFDFVVEGRNRFQFDPPAGPRSTGTT